jgi:uncharacterized protein YbjT (DUF2867 family)
MASPILVTGGTGTLGRFVVPRLRAAGRDVRVLSRHRREGGEGIEFVVGDLTTGEGIDAAVDGVETIVHLAGTSKGDEHKARHLVRAASPAGVRHLVSISVVGADRVPVVSGVDRAMFGYIASKLAAERVAADSGLPWTTLRATQFHQLMLTVAQQLAKLPVVPLPAGFRGRAAARVPAGHAPAAADRPGLAAWRGRPRVPRRRQPGPGPRRRPPHLGGLPGRPADLADPQPQPQQPRPGLAVTPRGGPRERGSSRLQRPDLVMSSLRRVPG